MLNSNIQTLSEKEANQLSSNPNLFWFEFLRGDETASGNDNIFIEVSDIKVVFKLQIERKIIAMKIKNNIKVFEVLRKVLIIRTMFNEKTLIKCTMLKGQKSRYSLTFKIRFKHNSHTSIIFYTYESTEPLTDETISDIYIKLIEMFNNLEDTRTIFVIDYGVVSLDNTEDLTARELTILQTNIFYKVVINNVLLQASTFIDGGKELLNFISDFMEDLNK